MNSYNTIVQVGTQKVKWNIRNVNKSLNEKKKCNRTYIWNVHTALYIYRYLIDALPVTQQTRWLLNRTYRQSSGIKIIPDQNWWSENGWSKSQFLWGIYFFAPLTATYFPQEYKLLPEFIYNAFVPVAAHCNSIVKNIESPNEPFASKQNY